MSWEDNTSRHHLPLPPWAQQRRSGASPRVAAHTDTQRVCLLSVAQGGVLQGGMACGTEYPWHNRPYGLDGLHMTGCTVACVCIRSRCS